MLWRFYDDREEHRLSHEGHLLTPDGRAIFNRCVAFLRSDLEYEWRDDNFRNFGGFGVAGQIITLGLSIFVDRWMRKREERRLVYLKVIGEEAIWPFLTSSDLTSRGESNLRR